MSGSNLKKIILAACFCIALSSHPVFAQTTDETDKKTEEAQPEAPRIRTLPPAYGPQLSRLAEILGALHYLRELCGANEGQLWREQMSEIITSEDPSKDRKADLIANFNRGFRSFREIHRECSPTAVEATNRYLRQGVRLSGEIPDRYGR